MRRVALGIIAAILLISGVVFSIQAEGGGQSMLAGSCVRAGIMLGAIWLAWPQLQDLASKTPWWLVTSVLLVGLLVAARPNTARFAIPILLVVLALKWFGNVFRSART